jgi:hypothetical protein
MFLTTLVLIAATVLKVDVDVAQLTLPVSERPAGCVLDANRGNAIGLPLAANPWYGNDRRPMAAIRERIAPPLVPDGPPLNARDAAAFRLHLADDLDHAYAAMYGSSKEIIAVMGVRFLDEAQAMDAAKQKGLLRSGRLVVAVSGGTSDCHAAVLAHVTKLMANPAPQH